MVNKLYLVFITYNQSIKLWQDEEHLHLEYFDLYWNNASRFELHFSFKPKKQTELNDKTYVVKVFCTLTTTEGKFLMNSSNSLTTSLIVQTIFQLKMFTMWCSIVILLRTCTLPNTVTLSDIIVWHRCPFYICICVAIFCCT